MESAGHFVKKNNKHYILEVTKGGGCVVVFFGIFDGLFW